MLCFPDRFGGANALWPSCVLFCFVLCFFLNIVLQAYTILLQAKRGLYSYRQG